jgi:hypothetical protein
VKGEERLDGIARILLVGAQRLLARREAEAARSRELDEDKKTPARDEMASDRAGASIGRGSGRGSRRV